MTTVRRLFLYLASFIGMVVALAGSFMLIGFIVERGFDAFRDFLIVCTQRLSASTLLANRVLAVGRPRGRGR